MTPSVLIRHAALNRRATGVAILFGACLALTSLATAQERTVEPGHPVPGTLGPDSKDVYLIRAVSGTFVYGEVNQITVDVVVTVLDPEGNELATFDSPARGPESFQFDTGSEGDYRIEVTPFERQEGDYEFQLLRTEPIATDPGTRVDQLMAPYTGTDRPGIVVAVVKEGETVFLRSYGMANLSHDIPFRTDTRSNIGSVTKQFTAMALLLLQQDGKLSLEDDIRTYIPELQDFGTPITLRNLLNHMSGYREIYNFLPMAGYQGVEPFRREDVIGIVQRQAALQARPGSVYNYNNTGYILLATTVERVSGMEFADFMAQRVFAPLGMARSLVKTSQGQIIPESAQGYLPAEEGGYVEVVDLAASYGAGGIYSTAEDLVRWMMNYRDGTVGGPEAIEAITTPAITVAGDTVGYGLGLGLGRFRGQKIYEHTGGDNAHRTYFGYLPEIESGVVTTSNHASFDFTLPRKIMAAFLEEHLEPVAEEPTRAESSGDQPSAEQLEAIAGDWIIDAGTATLPITYSVEEGELYAQAQNQPKFRVDPTSDSTFTFVGVPGASVTFFYESDGSVERAVHHQGGDVPMRRIVKEELSAEQLGEYAGRYLSRELETFYTLKVEGDEPRLMAHHLNMEPFVLNHSQEDTFSGSVWFLSTIKFVRDATGAVTGFMGGNSRTIDVWFEKMSGTSSVVERFVRHYNDHDVEAMLELVHPDIQWLSVSSDSVRVEAEGAQALATSMSAYFEGLPSARSSIESTMTAGRFVSVWERAHWEAGGESHSQSALSVYELEAGLIRRVWYFPAME